MYDLSLQDCSQATLKEPVVWIDPRFVEAVGELHQLEARLLLCHKGEQLVAAMPLYERKKLGIRRLIHPMSAYYQGLWFFWDERRDENRNLLDELKISTEVARFLKSRYRRLQLNLAPHNLDARGFIWEGLKAVPFYTFTHDLSLPIPFFRNERRKLRQAQSEGYRLQEKFRPDIFLEMVKILYDRKQKSLGVAYPAFGEWMRKLHEAGLLIQFDLMDKERLASSTIILGGENDRQAYPVMMSTLPQDLKKGASALHYHLMVESLRDRFDVLDFCGANYPDVARFKAALGLKLAPFFRIRK
ncbi:MAG: hypothetical protein WCY21_01445 [Candidatus Cloacimonadaceae bacterium]|jgi:hypothetical protein|nr:hypothetical protein [Candidatus Cloacimonadota bacterium]MDX9949062.1 hypothetical protein [Candidatus Syntrophosphaera sp.]NLN84756.1 hypothetical protein [Candidatus Cloacimonadota bacterium]